MMMQCMQALNREKKRGRGLHHVYTVKYPINQIGYCIVDRRRFFICNNFDSD